MTVTTGWINFGAEGFEAMDSIEFAARRRTAQEEAIAFLLPEVKDFIEQGPDAVGELAEKLTQLYVDTYLGEGGDRKARTAAFIYSMKSVLAHTEPDSNATRAATWMAVATINAATVQAAADDPRPILLKWTTMHDQNVREAHQEADRQRRPAGSYFFVGGENLRYPGDPRGSIENTINCRCVLQPVPANQTPASLTAAVDDAHDGAVIVALPHEADPIRDVGEEPKHLTLCWMGDSTEASLDQAAMTDQVAQAAQQIEPFNATVSKTGPLGDDGAYVAFLEPETPTTVRDSLLTNEAISTAVGAVQQHPTYTPHVTLSYEGEQPYEGTVTFDRLALWWGDDQQEFPLGSNETEPDRTNSLEETMPLETPLAWHGVLAPEGAWSGDGRRFALDSLRNRDLPLPLTWQRATNEGHDGSTVVGRINSIERVPSENGVNLMQAEGVWIDTPETDEIVGLVAEFGRFGVSVDADDSEFEFDEESGQVTFNSARIASASLVSIPAFAEAYIALGTWADEAAFPPKEGEEAPEEEECDPDAPDYEECVAAKARDEEPVDEDEPGWVPVAPKRSADSEAIAASQATSNGVIEMISDAAWDGSAGRFTPEQWKKSTVLHVCTGDEKSCHKLPIREPGGALSRAGVHAAASRFNQVDAPSEAKASAARQLRGAYKQLGEEPPDVLKASGEVDTFGRGPGWVTNPVETRRIWAYWTQPGHEGFAKINWGVPGDFNRCRTLVGEKIAANSPEDLRYLNQICAQWHHDATGFWPGRAPTELSLRPPKGEAAPSVTLVASGAIKAPADWFKNPNLTEPTHITVTEDGRVFGHIAEWSSCHIGYDGVCVAPPMSSSDYAYYASKRVLLDDGTQARTGVLSLGGGHAKGNLGFTAAIEHYDRTSAGVADIAVGEDEHGIWAAGWMRPGWTERQAYDLRASDISGDWREVRPGQMEMVAALAVNVAGFPVVAVHNQAQVALIAAGVVAKPDDPMDAVIQGVIKALARRDKMAQLRERVGV